MIRSIYLLLLLMAPFVSFTQKHLSQTGKVKNEIQKAQLHGVAFENAKLFHSLKPTESQALKKKNGAIKDAVYFDLVKSKDFNSISRNSSYLSLDIPTSNKQEKLTIDLVQVDIFSGDFVSNVDVSNGRHYRGVVRGTDVSLVSLSVFDEEVMGMISIKGDVFTLGKLKGESRTHVLYNEFKQGWGLSTDCNTDDSNISFNTDDIKDAAINRSANDCIREKIELDESLTNQLGGVSQATNYGTGIFNNQKTLYANDGINIVLSELKVWSNADPAPYVIDEYNTLDSYRALTGAYNGDVAYLGFYQGGWGGGVASSIGGICPQDVDDSKAIGGHYGSYSDVPTYSHDVMIISHELGHIFGARHTHACVWNGNNTAIDGCSGFTEGGCPVPSFSPNAGTIMSYCNSNDFNEGFHPQVAQAIQNYIASRTCTSPCGGGEPTCTDGIQNGNETGIDCGGPDCPACPTCTDGIQNGNETGVDCGGPDCDPCSTACSDNDVNVSITLDNYPEETSWTITDNNGTVVASGGTYGSEPDGSTISVDLCLVDGCYDFNISDSYGDGICCNYGSGSYTVSSGANTLASGGSFGSAESTNFCFGTTAPTCTDGIQNGSETGIDCGGPDCPACPTCTDGVQNGNETDVDCGGPDCPACPTCTDGIQNGNETGIDCGGPDCDPCSSGCSDNDVNVSITFDNYPEETSWTITNNIGTVMASGGTYGSEPDGSTISIDVCLVDGCYDFNISDSYGDGICCSYGSGSYAVTSGANLLANGGSFGSSESTNFCFGTTAPTCTDGIQNGNETGIDCGGPDCDPCDSGSNEIFGHYFESGWDNWQDGGSDCYRYSGSRSYEGSNSIRLRDNSGNSSSMTSETYDVSQYNSLELEFYFYSYSMENGEDFFVKYFDGNSWNTVASYARGVDFNNNTFYVATVIISSANYNMATNAQFRFQCDASGNGDHIYIDAVAVRGISNNNNFTSTINNRIDAIINHNESAIENLKEDFGVRLSPNPTESILNVEAQEEITRIKIYTIDGKVVRNISIDNNLSHTLDVDDLQSGLYFMSLETIEDIYTEKFVKR